MALVCPSMPLLNLHVHILMTAETDKIQIDKTDTRMVCNNLLTKHLYYKLRLTLYGNLYTSMTLAKNRIKTQC